jgi:general secretion pathway protein C
MSLPNNLSALVDKLAKLPQQKIAQTAVFLLIAYIAYLFAQITWMLVPQENTNSIPINTEQRSTSQSSKKQVNVKVIQDLALFGLFSATAEKIEEVIIEDAPETRLKLILAGVVASSDKATAAAIIENSGRQETYSIGETITGTRATLENVFNDRVLLKVSGKLETLMFEGMKFGQAVKAIKPAKKRAKAPRNKNSAAKFSSPNVVDQRNNKQLTLSASALKADLNKDPGKITDYLKISPKRENGKIVGYRIMPGKDPTFFQTSGLKTGDVAVQMNGYDLTAPSEAAQAMKSLKEQREVSLLLDRDGDMTEILFSIDN